MFEKSCQLLRIIFCLRMENIMSQRLRDVQNFLIAQRRVKNQTDFGKIMGKNRSLISEYVNGRRRVTRELAYTISEHFPEIDPLFLIDEEHTQMLVPSTNVQGNHNVVNNGHNQTVGEDTASLHRIIEKQQAQIDRLLGIIEKLQS